MAEHEGACASNMSLGMETRSTTGVFVSWSEILLTSVTDAREFLVVPVNQMAAARESGTEDS
jgi:hypothetical protein